MLVGCPGKRAAGSLDCEPNAVADIDAVPVAARDAAPVLHHELVRWPFCIVFADIIENEGPVDGAVIHIVDGRRVKMRLRDGVVAIGRIEKVGDEFVKLGAERGVG